MEQPAASCVDAGPVWSQPALPGSLASRYPRYGKAHCRCKVNPPVLHGPCLHGTRPVDGRTVTRTLTRTLEQAARYQPWFDTARRLRTLLADLEARSLQAFTDAED